MFGLTTTQLILLAAGAVWLFFVKSPGGGWSEIIKKIFGLGGGSSSDILSRLISEFFKCGKCTPEEAKAVQDALTVIVNHVVKHRLMEVQVVDIDSRVEALERAVSEVAETSKV